MQVIAAVRETSSDRGVGRADPVEEVLVDRCPAGVSLALGVAALSATCRAELYGGGEVGAALSDGFGGAVELDRSGAVAVAQHEVKRANPPSPVLGVVGVLLLEPQLPPADALVGPEQGAECRPTPRSGLSAWDGSRSTYRGLRGT